MGFGHAGSHREWELFNITRLLKYTAPVDSVVLTSMSAGASPGKRREMDVMKLMMSDWKVELVNDNISEFNVLFKGPTDSASTPQATACCRWAFWRRSTVIGSVPVRVSGIDPLLRRANGPAACHMTGWSCCAAFPVVANPCHGHTGRKVSVRVDNPLVRNSLRAGNLPPPTNPFHVSSDLLR